jgi:negative regulator of flagellin synthesis FlgM
LKITSQVNVQSILSQYNKNVKRTDATDALGALNDTVEISDRAREIQVAQKALAEIPEVRSDRVETIKSAIEGGQYKASAEDVVNKLLEGLNLQEK